MSAISRILVSILLVSAVLSFASISYFYSQYTTLIDRYNRLSRSFDELEKEYRRFYTMYKSLHDEHIQLMKEYRALSGRVSNLTESYMVLEANYSTLRINHQRLVDSYEDWRKYALSYLFFEDSISRVLNDSEILNLASLVGSTVSYPSDYWRSVKELYDYVRKNIGYAYDPPVPYPPLISDLERGVYVKTTYRQIVLSPSEALSYGQGDCEDQAILLYA
ncbi:MAG: transglutaminase-like domain-containing protein, partial [Candidatus Bathyarchaeota archaeon]|nr:transglutaminase-like domain-containing protein [Candidatus Bathyarchaeota archaeon]